MKNSDVIKIYRGLLHLIEPANPDGSPAKPYSFSGPVSYAIVRNLKKAKAVVDDYDSTRNNIVKGLMKDGETTIATTDERFPALHAELIKVLDSECEFVPHKIKLSGLELEKNSIQPAALLAMEPILIDGE